ncbi:MAG: putative Na+/H+ antiporter, partial [Pseudobdellovibrionaceae bacterium]
MTLESYIPYIATACFALAVLHTFSVKYFQEKSHQYPEGSVGENFYHLLGEVEVVFGIWAGFFILSFMAMVGIPESIAYLQSRDFTEPMFVFVIMTVCASRPILILSEKIIRSAGRVLPLNKSLGFYIAVLVVGPILGSFVTEPAAMTVTALIVLKNFFQKEISDQLRYSTLGLLFVNISIGGTLTPFAAPPVLMVASKWGWDLQFMFTNFGWKAIISILISTSIVAYRFRQEISGLNTQEKMKQELAKVPIWVTGLHLAVLTIVVLSSHYMVLFMGIFLFFLGIASVTKEYQENLKIREALLVGFFLA